MNVFPGWLDRWRPATAHGRPGVLPPEPALGLRGFPVAREGPRSSDSRSLRTDSFEPVFVCLLAIWRSMLETCPSRSFTHLKQNRNVFNSVCPKIVF